MGESIHLCNCLDCKLKTLFFDFVAADQQQILCLAKIENQFKKGEIIIVEGNMISDFIYLKSGLVKLTRRTSNGNEQILSFAKPFDFVSLLSIFSSSRYNYSVIAIEDTEICILDLQNVKNMILENGKFALNIMQKISDATDRIILDNLEIKRKHLHGRVAHLLIYFSDIVYKQRTIQLPISRQEIADYIGMTTENVIRALSEFKKNGIIRTYGKDIDIIDIERLKAISEHG